MLQILGQYQITFLDVNITQEKTLISQGSYDFAKILKDNPYSKSLADKGKEILQKAGNYFTDESPLWLAKKSGFLICNGKSKPVSIVEIV